MDKIKYYVIKYKKIIIITIVSIIVLLSIISIVLNSNSTNDVETLEIEETSKEEDKEKEIKRVKVDVKGYVNKPGVYELDATSRVIDAINSAGGLNKDANTEYLNLSKTLQDQMVIIVYSNSEVSKFKETDEQVIYIEKACKCPDNENDACISEEDVVNTIGKTDNTTSTSKNPSTNNSGTSSSTNKTQQTNTIVSINTGTLQELMTLTGIGESKAKAIIEYREKNNGFKTLEELMNVSGIGEKTYSKIKDRIKL